MKIIVKNAHVVDPFTGEEKIRDIFVEDEVFSEPFSETSADRIIEANMSVVTPGFIDVHAHLRDPGGDAKEDIMSGTRAAAAGGFVAVFSMPNTMPISDYPSILQYQIQRANNKGFCEVIPVSAATIGEVGGDRPSYREMRESGAVAVSDDGRVIASSAILRVVMEEASRAGLMVIDHCEEVSLSAGACMHEGKVSRKLGVKGMPCLAESIIVARDLLMSEFLDIPIHLCHISCKKSVELIRFAKSKGIKVTADTCPHYFSLTDKAVEKFNANAKMYPPLRSEEDREAIIEAVIDGTIDMISTDHAPHHEKSKTCGLEKAANGIIGFETAFTVSNTVLCEENGMPLMELFDRLSYRPSFVFGLGDRSISEGNLANFTILDTDASVRFDRDKMLSRSKNTPFDGWKGQGKVLLTMWRGKITHED